MGHRLARSPLGLAIAILLASAISAFAQDASSGILTIDPERLFEETAFGLRVQREIEERAAALSVENRRIEAELVEEERSLTEQRATLPVAEFRALADAFDVKVDRIRDEQDAKALALQEFQELERQRFFGLTSAVLTEVLAERRGLIVLDRRTVVASSDAIDVTEDMIRRMDQSVGDGSRTPTDP